MLIHSYKNNFLFTCKSKSFSPDLALKKRLRKTRKLENVFIPSLLRANIPVLFVVSRANQALLFDGKDDHVTLPSIHRLGLTDRYVAHSLVLIALEHYVTIHSLLELGIYFTKVSPMHPLCLAALL